MDLSGGDDRDVLDIAVVVDDVLGAAAASDPGQRRSGVIALEDDRIGGRGALAPEVDDRIAFGLAFVEDKDVVAAIAAKDIDAGSAIEDIIAAAAVDRVVAGV